MSDKPHIISHFSSKKPVVSEPLNLSLLIDNELFMYALFTQNYNELIELCHIRQNESMQVEKNVTERVKFLINNYQLSGKRFENVNISILNSDFTILPESFAVTENSREILEFSSGNKLKNSFSHKFNNLSFNYFIEPELIQFLEKTFKKATFHHAGAIVINLLFNSRSLKKCDLFLNFNEGIFELLAKENNTLLYYNVFNYETKEDVMYFLLFMMEQFNLDPDKVKLFIGGQMEAEGELHKAIKKYIKHVDFVLDSISPVNLNNELKIPDHFYFTLLNQHLCEL
jgi:hypothetical protein